MEDVRLANMFYEQRGPLVFSASVHLVLLVVGSIWMLLAPDQEKEPFNFELVPPPSGGAVQSESMPTLESLEYEPVDDSMPTLDDIKLPEREEIVVEIEQAPEPVVEVKQPVVEIAPAKPKQMSLEDFLKTTPDADKIKNVRTTPVRTKRPTIDVPVVKVSFEIGNLPAAEISSYSQADQDALGQYIAGFKESLKRAVKSHSSSGAKLSVFVSCDILANGTVRNIRILESSGDTVFDQKVVDGYNRIGSYARPPKGKALIGLQIWFIQD